MFTEWMKINTIHVDSRELTFADFLTKWVWQQKYKEWKKRESGRTIGRTVYAHPTLGERVYLGLLLNIVKGARSFMEIKNCQMASYTLHTKLCVILLAY